jgi:hypothetical protein
MPGQKQKYLDKNRNTWTKTEIFEQKQRYFDKDRSISIKEKYLVRNENTWTKTGIQGRNPIPLPRGLASIPHTLSRSFSAIGSGNNPARKAPSSLTEMA